MADSASTMTLRLLTPTGTTAETACDGVLLMQRDSAEGHGGGLVGIREDHAPAVIALGEGPVIASLGTRTVFRASVAGGFASVQENVVTVITDNAVVDPDPASAERDR